MNFKEMYLSGLCDFDHIDQCIGQWHDSTENGLELIDHLGLTQAEYGLFLRQDPAATLQSCLNSQRHCQHYRIYQLDLSDGKTVPFAFAGIQKMREKAMNSPPPLSTGWFTTERSSAPMSRVSMTFWSVSSPVTAIPCPRVSPVGTRPCPM